jgi:hypothetical protein
MTKPLREYIETGELHDLANKGLLSIHVLTKVYLWERVQTIIDENPTQVKMRAIEDVALECKCDESTVLRAYNFVSKIV